MFNATSQINPPLLVHYKLDIYYHDVENGEASCWVSPIVEFLHVLDCGYYNWMCSRYTVSECNELI